MLQTGVSDMQIWAAGLLFAVVFPGVSFLLNRRVCGGHLNTDVRQIALLAALTFLAAILCEATVNPLYMHFVGEKLWEYRLLPLHDSNVSALAALIWSSYGVHLYFLNQSLDRRLAPGPRRLFAKAGLIGAEAPLLWEISGNGIFLLLLDEYYAYYLPGDLGHLTSLRVVPIYMLCVLFGLLVHEHLRHYAHDWRIAGGCFGAGVLFLLAG